MAATSSKVRGHRDEHGYLASDAHTGFYTGKLGTEITTVAGCKSVNDDVDDVGGHLQHLLRSGRSPALARRDRTVKVAGGRLHNSIQHF
jgi:hypothetical protein